MRTRRGGRRQRRFGRAFDGTKAEKVASEPGSVPNRAERVKELIGNGYMLDENEDAVDVEFTLN